MSEPQGQLWSKLQATVDKAKDLIISENRKRVLQPLIDYMQKKVDQGQEVHLNFICTHNSRRSQFSQVWAQTFADYFELPVHCNSGGVEVTAFNERAVASLKRSGFQITSEGKGNPRYSILHSQNAMPIIAFSKLFDDPVNEAESFAAVMTCSHADENCPFIPGTEQRISVNYEDPKEFDGTPLESEKYDERSMQIASELFYVFTKIQK